MKLFRIVPHHLFESANRWIECRFGRIERLQEFLFVNQQKPSESILDIHSYRENCISLDLYFRQAIHLLLDRQQLSDGGQVKRHHRKNRQDHDGEDQDNLMMD